MRLLLETICIREGRPQGLSYHKMRMAHSVAPLSSPTLPNLASLCPEPLRRSRCKCRIVYSAKGIEEISFTPYHPKPLRALRIVEAPTDLNYEHKWLDRYALESLRQGCAADEDILICRDGLLTDISYANVLLSRLNTPKQFLYTPAKPLLYGTHLAQLASSLHFEPIPLDHLWRDYHSLSLINAMLDVGEIQIPVEHIYFP
ncbi:MAG: hypothetical protein SPI72_02720 [Porphyromonas sp.]|nr:hypothetical protein [Porphyromonas sp.]